MIRNHLKNRHMNLSLHMHWLDSDVATFPLFNQSGQMSGYQRYSPLLSKEKKNAGKYYTYGTGVWGLESWNLSNTLFLTEGIFDACRLTNKGVSAVAVLSNNPKQLKNWVYIISQQRPIVVVCDNDKAGKQLIKYGTHHYIMQETDLGDAPDDEVNNIIKLFTFPFRWFNINLSEE